MNKILQRTRLGIWASMENQNPAVSVCFKDKYSGKSFLYPIDEFKVYLQQNTNVLNTRSYDDGCYHWPRVPKKFYDFLDKYEVFECDKNLETSTKRDYNPTDMNKFLSDYNEKNGHCYISNMLLDDEDGDVNKVYAHATQIRLRYKENKLSKAEISALKKLGFIFHTKLGHYFKKNNWEDRKYLIQVLKDLTSFESEIWIDEARPQIEKIREEVDKDED